MTISLEEYSNKRFQFSGKAVIEKTNPYFIALDKFRYALHSNQNSGVSFATYDYLGISGHPAVEASSIDALKMHGVGALASRIIGGERTSHGQFERSLAEFIGVEDVLTLVSGYLANVTTVSHITDSRDAIFIDELSHNSLFTGSRTSVAKVIIFRHNDLEQLADLLEAERANYRNVLIITEALFSMDGDVVDLPRLLEIRDRFKTWVLIDEAHSIGVLGQTGRGICEHTGTDPKRVDLIIGTLSKTFASCGGFVAGKADVIRWLRYTLPGFVYSVGLSPVITAAAGAALEVLRTEPWRVRRLRENSQLFMKSANANHFDTGSAIGEAIVPILFSNHEDAMEASLHLLGQGFYAPPIIHVTGPKILPRIRFFMSAAHSEDELSGVLRSLMQLRANHEAFAFPTRSAC